MRQRQLLIHGLVVVADDDGGFIVDYTDEHSEELIVDLFRRWLRTARAVADAETHARMMRSRLRLIVNDRPAVPDAVPDAVAVAP